ncbi:MAG TPA: helix-turn-helix domain-containing protein [Candidatus Paceibacterota bacterium]|nr:helix-turn-helix domain-containing protein [Candidatus Paceibacterota bacterium]
MKTQDCKECPISKVVELLGDSCSILILRDLFEGPKRFGQLQTSLDVSTRTLTIKLKKLEQEGLVVRTEYHEHPPRVEYSLTKKGAAFQEVEDAMRAYGKKYL